MRVGHVRVGRPRVASRAHREAIARHERALLGRLRSGLVSVPGVEELSVFDSAHDRVGVVAFTLADLDSALVAQALSAEHGIGVRAGRFCAHPLIDELLADLWGETTGTAVRASLGLATTAEAVDRLVAAVRTLVERGPSGEWSQTALGWVLADDPRDVEVTRPW